MMSGEATKERGDRSAAPWLGAVERLDLALFVKREGDSMRRRIDIEADDVGQLGGEARIARALEGAYAMRLQLARSPDALRRAQRHAHRFGHCAAGPMGRLVRRVQYRSAPPVAPRFPPELALCRLAGLVAQQTLSPCLGKALLPAPHRRSADADGLRHALRRPPIRRREHDARPLDVLARPVAVGHDSRQLLALRGVDNHTYRLGSPEARLN